MIILFGGKFASGKTKCCEILSLTFGFKEINFANKLKEVAIDLFDMDPVKKDRNLLQKLGTEALRSLDNDVWVKYLFNKTLPKLQAQGLKDFCIGDGRFKNEVEYGTKHGALNVYIAVDQTLKLERYQETYGELPTEEQMNHASELTSPSEYDVIIENNGTPEELKEKITNLVNNYDKLIKQKNERKK